MKHYVLGFAFSADKKEIILIEKQKPDWQKGKLNGVGGKVEDEDKCCFDFVPPNPRCGVQRGGQIPRLSRKGNIIPASFSASSSYTF